MHNINFKNFPILTTKRLILRQLLTDDQQDIFELRSDKEINKYLSRKPCTTVGEAIDFIKNINDNSKQNKSIYWVISLTGSQKLLGTICLYDFSIKDNSCEIGYELGTKSQGQGIMKEALEAVINYTFQTLNFKKILAHSHKGNDNSSRLLTKFKFLKSNKLFSESGNLDLFTLTRNH